MLKDMSLGSDLMNLSNFNLKFEDAKEFTVCGEEVHCDEIKVTIKSGEAYDLMFYHELKSGIKHSDVVKWAMKRLIKTIHHPENIVDARFIMG